MHVLHLYAIYVCNTSMYMYVLHTQCNTCMYCIYMQAPTYFLSLAFGGIQLGFAGDFRQVCVRVFVHTGIYIHEAPARHDQGAYIYTCTRMNIYDPYTHASRTHIMQLPHTTKAHTCTCTRINIYDPHTFASRTHNTQLTGTIQNECIQAAQISTHTIYTPIQLPGMTQKARMIKHRYTHIQYTYSYSCQA